MTNGLLRSYPFPTLLPMELVTTIPIGG